MTNHTSSFQERVEEEVKRLELLVDEAAEADRIFHEAWQKETRSFLRAAAYKQTETYKQTLQKFYETLEHVHAAVQTEVLLEAIKTGHPTPAQLVTAFAYLKLKKRHFRSGYMKETI